MAAEMCMNLVIKSLSALARVWPSILDAQSKVCRDVRVEMVEILQDLEGIMIIKASIMLTQRY